MRAAVYRTKGPASEVLRVEELETPRPGPGEVLVRVAVSGVNPTDWKARDGEGEVPGGFQVPDQDGAGTVEAVGEGVDPGRVGQRVWLWFAARERPWGTAAEYTVVPARQAVPLPDGASFDLGASIGIPAMTAWHCLFADGPVDGPVLVSGGAGAVGNAAIRLAKAAGLTVVSTVSSDEKAAAARDAGADAVVDYRAGSVDDTARAVRAAAPDGVSRVVEVAPASNAELNLQVGAPHLVVASYADDGEPVPVPGRRSMLGNVSWKFVLVYTIGDRALDAAVAGVSEAVAAGTLVVPPLHRFSLDDVAAAHDAVQQGAVGKVVIDV
ncbi:NADPH:quinone reductase [Angustibacter aerolatus]